MLDAEKGPDPALVRGEDTGAVGAPHDPGLLSGDRALVQLHLALRPAAGSEEVRFPHEPEHPFAGGAHTLEHPQAGPHLAVAFALKGRGLQIAADESEECIIGEVRLGAALVLIRPWAAGIVVVVGVVARAGDAEGAAGSLDAVGLSGGRGYQAAHLFDIPAGKGIPCLRQRSRRSSFSMRASPRRLWASARRSSAGPVFLARSPASRPARACSRHSSRR